MQDAPFALDPELCYAALSRRDPRFDGRFFVGVRTTGIFCRPICPAPLPRPTNCSFWLSAAAAQAAGFRPCLRCRPEAAPGTPAWRGTAASVSRALRLIESGGLDEGASVDDLAEQLGMGARHLRRLFDDHLGAAPRAVAKMRRVLFAKQLIDETDLAMTEVALASGFGSQRRFNACIQEVYGRSPRELRRQRRSRGATGGGLELTLAYRPPLAWSALLEFFRDRAIPGVEAVEGGSYLRTLRIPGGLGSIRVRHDEGRRRLVIAASLSSSDGLIEICTRLRQLFDLDADVTAIDSVLENQALLRGHVRDRPGLRVPGAFDPFETAVRAILGQQISVKGATTLAGRVAARWGEPIPRSLAQNDGLTHVFPTPQRLARAKLEAVGIVHSRAATIRGLAQAVVEDASLLQPGSGLEGDLARWTALRGIGPWTAHYVSMRVLRESDALPASDLGLRKAISRPGEDLRPASEVETALEGCRPYRAYAAMRLWSKLAVGV